MGAIGPQQLYQEFQTDPSALGYAGVPFNDKQTMINEVRDNIIIKLISVDAEVINPGEIKGTLAIQLIRDAIHPDEWESNCQPTNNEDPDTQLKESLRDKISVFWGGSDGQSQFSFTDNAISQILDTFKAATWPLTRAAILALRDQPGSRAAQLFGSPDAPVTRDDMLAAEQWGQDNGQPSLYE